jgi:2,3-bisphosphoglycerate-independent phosphoglycerate mutase
VDLALAKRLARPANTKIVLCVVDGLGGLARQETLRSELEAADIPNLDRLATRSEVGLTVPVGAGITPGSGPGHLALFGYDPLRYEIGRGALEAAGVGFELGPSDVAFRGNLCTLDASGAITDRRAGRIATSAAADVLGSLRGISVSGVEVLVQPVRDHRFLLVMRGPGLDAAIADTDPGREGLPPLAARAAQPSADSTATLLNAWLAEAARKLAAQPVANGLLLRGASTLPQLPSITDTWQIRAAAVAGYPMYRGLARLAGMDLLDAADGSLATELAAVRDHWDEYDYFFVHYKPADTAGEDGDFEAKTHALRDFDTHVADLTALNADVLMIAGDHSTPALMAGHSWHPVPFLLSSAFAREGAALHFTEEDCLKGSLGIFPAVDVMALAMAHAGRLTKFGA